MAVVIVGDPEKGISEGNLIARDGNDGPCKHLKGSGPGDYECDVHDYPWYEDTPCFQFTQVERGNTECRLGRYTLGVR